jgi:hypothetical protein
MADNLRLIFDNFMKGTISRVTPERCPQDAFSDSENISLNEKFMPIKAKGQKIYNTGANFGNYACRGGCVYKRADGTKYYVVAAGGFLWYGLAGSTSFLKYQISGVDLTMTETATVEFAQYNNKLYVVNGQYPVITNTAHTTDRMIKIDGTTPVGLTVSDIPSGLQFIKVDKERLFGFNSIAQPNGLFWTNAYFDYSTNSETNWTPVSGLNYDYVGKDDGEIGSAIEPYQTYMYVFKNRNIYKYSTAGDITNWGSIRLDTLYGCPFNRTIQNINGVLYWLSPDGVVRYDGSTVQLIDDNIREDILELPQLASSSRQWSAATATVFDAGTFEDSVLDTSDNQLILKDLGGTQTKWELWTRTNIDTTTESGKVILGNVANVFSAGNLLSETIDFGYTPAAWGTIVTTQVTNGGTIVIKTQSSSNGSTWEAEVTSTGGAINSTLAQYLRIKIYLTPDSTTLKTPEVSSIYVGNSWRSAIQDLGAAPAAWGNFNTVYSKAGQTLTWWIRSATTSGGIAAATWIEQKAGFPIVLTTLHQYIQIEVRMNTSDITQIPIMESFVVNYYTGTVLSKPCAYGFGKEYGLCVTQVGDTVNNIVWRYHTEIKYFLKRTNKYCNFFMIDEVFLLSGTSAATGDVRLNEVGVLDDTTVIDSWFTTKNVEQGLFNNVFRDYIVGYKADASWTYSYSLDNGANWTDITVLASGSTKTIKEVLPGLVIGHFIMLKCRQAATDGNWEVGEFGVEFEQGYEI